MKIAIWKTGHEIADTVAKALEEGFNASIYDTSRIQGHGLSKCTDDSCVICKSDLHVCYGILRGTSDVFKISQAIGGHWLQCDRGYFAPGHFNGYYRISYKGTQAKYDPEFLITKEFDGNLKPLREFDASKPVLICPPTDYVKGFFKDIEDDKWLSAAVAECNRLGLKSKIRTKDMSMESAMWDVMSSCLVYTFNCSLGWKAMAEGIPCLSDTQHSVVGSYYNTISIDEAIEMFHSKPRKPLFDFMRSHQLTLDEIRRGDAWPLINYYLSKYGSGTTAEKPFVQTSLATAFSSARNHP